MKWNVEVTRKAFKQLQKLPTQIQDLADEAIESLEVEGAVPKFWDVKKLNDNEYRIRVCLHFASLSENPLIFEHRTGAYMPVCEERSTENQWILAKIVEM